MAPPARFVLFGFNNGQSKRLDRLLRGSGFEVTLAGAFDPASGQSDVDPCDIAVVFISSAEPRRGLELIRDLRAWADTAIIAISDSAGLLQRIPTIDAGADVFLIEPYDAAEMLANVRALLRRCGQCRKTGKLRYGDAVVDQIENRFNWNGVSVPLSRMELRLLQLLISANGFTVRTETLLQELWGGDDESRRQSLRVLVRSLRKKIETNPTEPAFIINEFGVGYHLRRGDVAKTA